MACGFWVFCGSGYLFLFPLPCIGLREHLCAASQASRFLLVSGSKLVQDSCFFLFGESCQLDICPPVVAFFLLSTTSLSSRLLDLSSQHLRSLRQVLASVVQFASLYLAFSLLFAVCAISRFRVLSWESFLDCLCFGSFVVVGLLFGYALWFRVLCWVRSSGV